MPLLEELRKRQEATHAPITGSQSGSTTSVTIRCWPSDSIISVPTRPDIEDALALLVFSLDSPDYAIDPTALGDIGPEDPYRTVRESLARIQSSGRAEPGALRVAERALPAIMTQGLEDSCVPDRLVLDADGDISLFFFGGDRLEGGAHRRMASLSFSEDGLSALTQDRGTNEIRAWNVHIEAIPDTLARLSGFLRS